MLIVGFQQCLPMFRPCGLHPADEPLRVCEATRLLEQCSRRDLILVPQIGSQDGIHKSFCPLLLQYQRRRDGLVDHGIFRYTEIMELIEPGQKKTAHIEIFRLERLFQKLSQHGIQLKVPPAGSKADFLQQGKFLRINQWPLKQSSKRALLLQEFAQDSGCLRSQLSRLHGAGTALASKREPAAKKSLRAFMNSRMDTGFFPGNWTSVMFRTDSPQAT